MRSWGKHLLGLVKWAGILLVLGLLFLGVVPTHTLHGWWFERTGSEGSLRALAYLAKNRYRNYVFEFSTPPRGHELTLQRTRAEGALANVMHRGDGRVVRKLLMSDKDPEIRGTLALAIGMSRSQAYRWELAQLLSKDPDRLVRLYAAGALYYIKMDGQPLNALRQALKDESVAVRGMAAMVLAEKGEDVDRAVLKELTSGIQARNPSPYDEKASAAYWAAYAEIPKGRSIQAKK